MGQTNYNDWNELFINYLKRGKYTFTYDDISKEFPLSGKAISQGLLYNSKKQRIVKLRKGFYGILTPENSIDGILPIYSFIDDLMKYLHKPYYLALLSAGVLHGAAHQKPMVDFVVTETPAPRSIVTPRMKVFFISKHSWQQTDIVQKKGVAGYINVSSPELTAFDLIIYIDKIKFNLAATVLQELYEVMKPSVLKRVAKQMETPVIQRLGYILDRFVEEKVLSDALQKVLKSRKIKTAPLSVKKSKSGEIDDKWKIVINTEIDPDL
jgi:predicted transcriptional regulator of viral defense system